MKYQLDLPNKKHEIHVIDKQLGELIQDKINSMLLLCKLLNYNIDILSFDDKLVIIISINKENIILNISECSNEGFKASLFVNSQKIEKTIYHINKVPFLLKRMIKLLNDKI